MKVRGCKICREKFKPERSFQRVCSPKCAIAQVKVEREKASTRELRARRAALRPISHHLKSTQLIFNKFIRLRDELLPCVSCGRHHQGQYHCGHFQPRSTHGMLRFSELNTAKQCSPCNNFKSGNLVLFRIELIKRIGLEKVEFLEAPEQRERKRWTEAECDDLKKYYRQKIKDLQAVSVTNVPF